MPKFIYTVIAADIMVWALWYHRLQTTAPDSTFNKLFFVFLLTIAIIIAISIPIYGILQKNAPTLTNLKKIYRKSLRYSLFIGSCCGLFLLLKVFELFNFLNVLLILALYAAVYFQILKDRRF